MLRAVVAVALTLFLVQARAQVSGSATLASDYRFRDVSLSDDGPSAQLAFGYDWPSNGWYAGGVMSTVRIDQQNAAQLLGYAGFAQRVLPDLSWEAGVRYSRFTGRDSYAYAETFVGLTYKQFVGRVYYAPSYFSFGNRVLYAELNGSHALAKHWYVFGHAGYLRSDGHAQTERSHLFRSDFRAGLGLALQPWDIQLGWTTAHGDPGYTLGYPTNAGAARDAWVLSTSYAW